VKLRAGQSGWDVQKVYKVGTAVAIGLTQTMVYGRSEEGP